MDLIEWNDLKLILIARSNWFNVISLLFGIILIISLTSCDGITTGIPTATPEIPTQQPEPLRPEPQEPHIFVSFSGLNENALGRIYFRTRSGDIPLRGSHPGNGEMRVVIPEHQAVTYIVSAEAVGYVSDPISYTIHISGTLVYLVENGQITSKEALNLNFQFISSITPTGD